MDFEDSDQKPLTQRLSRNENFEDPDLKPLTQRISRNENDDLFK